MKEKPLGAATWPPGGLGTLGGKVEIVLTSPFFPSSG